jgi:hypothetical protein
MEIKIENKPKAISHAFSVFAEPNLAFLLKEKRVVVSFRFETNTRIATSMQFGQYCVGINFPFPEYKTVAKEDFSFVTGGKVTRCYFVVSKKQNFQVYTEYVKAAVAKALKTLGVELDEITIELEGTF